MNDLHVLILPSWYPIPESPLNGIFFKEQARALRESGLRIGIVAPIQRSIRELRGGNLHRHRFIVDLNIEAGIPTYRSLGWALPKCWRLNRMLFLTQASRLVGEYVNQFGRPDLIHAHSFIWGGIAAQRAAAAFSVPYIVTEHSSLFGRGLIPEWQKPEIAAALLHASACIAVSGSLREKLQEYSSNCQIDIVPNITDTTFFRKPKTRRSINPFVFLTVSFLNANKGVSLLLQAFAAKFKGIDDVEVWIGGDGPERKNLERLAAKLGISKQLKFLGMLTREEVCDVMWKASAFVLPSYHETFGVVFVEAMSTGLPVIGTRCGGPEEIITPRAGHLVATGDIAGLGNAMVALRDNYSHYNPDEISLEMEERFGTDSVVRRIKHIYDRVLSNA